MNINIKVCAFLFLSTLYSISCIASVQDDLLKAIYAGNADAAMAITDTLSKDQLNYPVTRSGGSVLHAVIQRGYRKNPEIRSNILQGLIDRGADPDFQDNQNRTPIFYLSVTDDSPGLLELMINAKADINHADVMGQTPMHLFAQRKSEQLVKMLLDNGASYKVMDKNGASPLLLAAGKGGTNVVNLLIDVGANISSTDNKGNSVIHYAALARDLKTVDLLIEKGVSVDQKNKKEETALSIFASAKQWASVRHLLALGADPNVPMRNESSVALFLMMNPELGMGDLVPREKINVNLSSDTSYGNPFLNALRKCDIEEINTLIDLGLDINAMLPGNQSAVFYVAQLDSRQCENRLELLQLILKKGGDVNLRQGRSNETPLELAIRKRYADVAEILFKYGADINILTPKEQRRGLSNAILYGDVDLVRFLIEHGVQVDTRLFGDALMSARYDVAKLLLQTDFDMDFNSDVLWLGIEKLAKLVSKDEFGNKETSEMVLFSEIFALNPVVDFSQNHSININKIRKRLEDYSSITVINGMVNVTFMNEKSLSRYSRPGYIATPAKKDKEPLKIINVPSIEYPDNADMHVIGVYEGEKSKKDSAPWWANCKDMNDSVAARECHRKYRRVHPEGKVVVDVYAKKPVLLALMSYEPVEWVISNKNGTNVAGVILAGYYGQKIIGLDSSVPVGVYTHKSSTCGQCQVGGKSFYAYKRNSRDFNVAMNRLDKITGRTPVSFQGAYTGKKFSIIDK